MTIDLRPEQQRVIDLAVRSGAYRSPGEVLDQAIANIREQFDLEDWMMEARESVGRPRPSRFWAVTKEVPDRRSW